jgi:hypothetical protein
LNLSCVGFSGKSYQLQYKDDLRDANWQNAGGAIVAPYTGGTATFAFSDAIISRRFYRVLQLD